MVCGTTGRLLGGTTGLLRGASLGLLDRRLLGGGLPLELRGQIGGRLCGALVVGDLLLDVVLGGKRCVEGGLLLGTLLVSGDLQLGELSIQGGELLAP